MSGFQNNPRTGSARKTQFADIIERLSQFEGSPEQFLANLLAVQCFLAQASCGAILRHTSENSVDILAVHPQLEQASTAPPWLAQMVELVRKFASKNTTTVVPLYQGDDLYGQPALAHIVLIPLRLTQAAGAFAAFVVEAADTDILTASLERLELTANLLSFYEMRLTLQQQKTSLIRIKNSAEVLAAVNNCGRFFSAAMSFCNEFASRCLAERVSIGFLKGRYIQVKAISHTENFSRKMTLVQDIESAMEEAFDQDTEVLYPAPPQALFISRSAAGLANKYGPLTVLSLPLRRNGQPLAVVTIERAADNPFTVEQIETIRLVCQLSGPVLIRLYETDRWLGARLWEQAKPQLVSLLNPQHTWAKVIAVSLCLVIIFLFFARGQFKAEAPFVFEAANQQMIPAPFDGYLKTVDVEAGDIIDANKTILANLDTAQLRLQLAEAKAEKLGYSKLADAAMRDLDTSKAQISQADADKTQAKIDLLEYQIKQADIISPLSGVVVEGDLKKKIGAPVRTGDVLFKVASLDSLRAQLSVTEDLIADIKVGQKGSLAALSYPTQKIEFVVEHIDPIAVVINQRNVFKVRVQLLTKPAWIRPGMEGVAKINAAKRSYAWIWTHRITNWIRMKLWL